VRLAIVLALAACGKDSDHAAPAGAVVVPTSTCTTAATNAMTLAKHELKRAAPEMIELLPKISELTIAHCTEDRWSAEAISCMTTARKPADTEHCQELLTEDQRKRMSDAMATVKP
jgi:hypothetical protein